MKINMVEEQADIKEQITREKNISADDINVIHIIYKEKELKKHDEELAG